MRSRIIIFMFPNGNFRFKFDQQIQAHAHTSDSFAIVVFIIIRQNKNTDTAFIFLSFRILFGFCCSLMSYIHCHYQNQKTSAAIFWGARFVFDVDDRSTTC